MLNKKTIWELQDLLHKGEVKPQEIVEDVFQQIERVEERLGAYITLTKEFAFKQAEEAENRLIKKEGITPLTGIPLAIKDNIIFAQKVLKLPVPLKFYITLFLLMMPQL